MTGYVYGASNRRLRPGRPPVVRKPARRRRPNGYEVDPDELCADLLAVTKRLTRWRARRAEGRPELTICSACGALERADRACMVCAATRAAMRAAGGAA